MPDDSLPHVGAEGRVRLALRFWQEILLFLEAHAGLEQLGPLSGNEPVAWRILRRGTTSATAACKPSADGTYISGARQVVVLEQQVPVPKDLIQTDVQLDKVLEAVENCQHTRQE